jgi:hypothetical protein
MTHHGGILISITPEAIAKAFGLTDMLYLRHIETNRVSIVYPDNRRFYR